MRIDDSTVTQARTADVLAFFEKFNGFTFAHRGGAYRCRQHPSLAVNNDRLSWYWHSKGIGGYGVLDYLVKVENMPFREAVEDVTGTTPTIIPPQHETEQPKTLVLPEKAGLSLRLYDYLCKKRGIDSEIVNALIQREMLYEDRRGNVVFVGYDEQDKARFASVRGTYGGLAGRSASCSTMQPDCRFRGDCAGSDKRYSFCMAASAPSERLYIFESAIDAMSHASLVNAATGDTGAWKRDCRLSLSGTSDTALNFFLNQHTAVNELVFCLDNDLAGHEATVMMAREYAYKGYMTLNEPPQGKDYNEDLLK
jgi:hypothetical protein